MVIFITMTKIWYNPLNIGYSIFRYSIFRQPPYLVPLCICQLWGRWRTRLKVRNAKRIVKRSTIPHDSIVRIRRTTQKIGKEHMPNKPESSWPIAAIAPPQARQLRSECRSLEVEGWVHSHPAAAGS
jgi:hypothetical protein